MRGAIDGMRSWRATRLSEFHPLVGIRGAVEVESDPSAWRCGPLIALNKIESLLRPGSPANVKSVAPKLRRLQPLERAAFVGALAMFLCMAGPATVRLGHASPPRVQKTLISASDEADDCVDCHEQEVDGFARSKMAHSMRLPGQEPEGIVRVPGTVIRMDSNREGAWQTLESDGDTAKYRVAYVIGSGAHASGYIISLANHLFQSPVAYYRRRAAYGLAPGYENKPDPDFTRPVEPGCLFCHADSFTAVSGTENEYAATPFQHLSISCSRCHGPIDAHLRHASSTNIVNPARLEPAARDSVCEQCHLKGLARVLNPGKKLTDFVAGQPLEQTFTIYRYAVPIGTEPPFKVISQSEELALSRCKRASGDRMWCGTCHDPHNEPQDPVSYYRARCLSCHADTHFASDHPPRTSDCIGCHMPKRKPNDGGHTVFTDHRIQRTNHDTPAAEPTGIVPWRDPPAELAKRNLGMASIEAGIEGGSEGEVESGYRTLTEVQDQFPLDSEMYWTIGYVLYLRRQYGEAATNYELAVRFDPNSSPKEASLGSAYAALGRSEVAEMYLERALDLDPLNLSAAELLIGLYEKNGRPEKAEAVRQKIQDLIR